MYKLTKFNIKMSFIRKSILNESIEYSKLTDPGERFKKIGDLLLDLFEDNHMDEMDFAKLIQYGISKSSDSVVRMGNYRILLRDEYTGENNELKINLKNLGVNDKIDQTSYFFVLQDEHCNVHMLMFGFTLLEPDVSSSQSQPDESELIQSNTVEQQTVQTLDVESKDEPEKKEEELEEVEVEEVVVNTQTILPVIIKSESVKTEEINSESLISNDETQKLMSSEIPNIADVKPITTSDLLGVFSQVFVNAENDIMERSKKNINITYKNINIRRANFICCDTKDCMVGGLCDSCKEQNNPSEENVYLINDNKTVPSFRTCFDIFYKIKMDKNFTFQVRENIHPLGPTPIKNCLKYFIHKFDEINLNKCSLNSKMLNFFSNHPDMKKYHDAYKEQYLKEFESNNQWYPSKSEYNSKCVDKYFVQILRKITENEMTDEQRKRYEFSDSYRYAHIGWKTRNYSVKEMTPRDKLFVKRDIILKKLKDVDREISECPEDIINLDEIPF